MSLDTACALEIAAVVAVALVIVVVVAASSGACGRSRAPVHDVELALGADTLMTYEQAAAVKKNGNAPRPPVEGKEEEEDCCVICLSEYAEGGELVRVVPACGHFFHADCGVDGWLRARRTCPICRGGLLPLPMPPRPECPPMPPRARVGSPQ